MKKSLHSLIIIGFLVVFSIFKFGEFYEFQKNKQAENIDSENYSQDIRSFSLEKIRELKDTYFYATPDKLVSEQIIDKIDDAETRVYLEVYIFTHTSIRDALVRAHGRGVDVKVVLEKNPYKAWNINDKTYDYLANKNLDIVWSDSGDYSLNHAKFIIMDNELLLSTGNFSFSSFSKNRDLFIFTSDQQIVDNFEEIFVSDYAGIKSPIYDDSLVLSPDYSRDKFEALFEGAGKSIKIYFQYLLDDKLFDLLLTKSEEGIDIEIVLDWSAKDDLNLNRLINSQVKISFVRNPKIHSKAILIDEKYLFIGSVNFSSYSLDKNRETGILLRNEDIISEFLEIFKKDISNNYEN